MTLARRSHQPEWMDTEVVTPADFAACLADLAVVNTVTLARAPTVGFMRRVARGLPPGARLRVLDVGYGEGDMLRRIHRWGTRRGLRLELSGVDLSPWSALAARAATPPGMDIEYRTGNLFDLPPGGYDVVLSSLFTHHLGRTFYLPNEHDRWPLRRLEVLHLEDTLVAAAGLPGITLRPPDSALFSAGVRTRFGGPQHVPV